MESRSITASTGASPRTVGSAANPAILLLPDDDIGNSVAAAVTPRTDDASSKVTEDADQPPPEKKSKKCTSYVWKYFTKSTEIVTNPDGTTEEQIWAQCSKCKYKGRGETLRGTTCFRNHLEAKHFIKEDQQTLQLVKSGENTATVQSYKYDAEVCHVKWQLALIMHDYPFSMVEHEYFVDFIRSLRPSFAFKGRKTIRDNIVHTFKEETKKLYDYLRTVNSRFSATMDMWTSIQNKSYMCITVHWIDEDWNLQRRIIKFMQVKGSHTGKRLGEEFCKGVMKMGLEKRLFALTLDNASNNDKCVQEIVPTLNSRAPLICGGTFFHVRCLCHILNLVAQDGLKIIAHTVKNIRATIAIVKNSPLQYEEFEKCALEERLDIKLGLSLDCPTRWNSSYDMLRASVYYRKALDKLVYLNKSKYKKTAPTDAEWTQAINLLRFLKKLKDATDFFSGNLYPTVNMFWSKFCEIKLAIEEWSYSTDDGISSMATAMLQKYKKYWEKSNKALAMGVFLDPRYKKDLVEYFLVKIYPYSWEHEMDQFMEMVNTLFQSYKSSTKEVAKADAVHSRTSHLRDDFLDDMDQDINQFLYDRGGNQQSEKSELEHYMAEGPKRIEGKFDILAWWKNKEGTYPVISRMARDVLAIQVSTVASESAFSAGGRVVDPFRTRLDPEVVEALICTKDWTAALKRAAKPRENISIQSIVDELEELLVDPKEKEAEIMESEGENESD